MPWMRDEPRHDKTNKMSVLPATTQIRLGIRPVWSESSLSAWRKLWSLATQWAHSKDSDLTGRMPRLIWVFAGRTLILLVLSCRSSFSHHVDRHSQKNKTFKELLSRLMTKPTKWHVRPAKTQISLGIRPVWSVFAVRMKKARVLSYALSTQHTCDIFLGSNREICNFW